MKLSNSNELIRFVTAKRTRTFRIFCGFLFKRSSVRFEQMNKIHLKIVSYSVHFDVGSLTVEKLNVPKRSRFIFNHLNVNFYSQQPIFIRNYSKLFIIFKNQDIIMKIKVYLVVVLCKFNVSERSRLIFIQIRSHMF